MSEQNMYVCPHCGGHGVVDAIIPLIEDVRYDAVSCNCGARWRVYYRFTSPKLELVYMPREEEATKACNEESTKACNEEG